MRWRGLYVWAVCSVLITFIVISAIGVFYIGYAIDRNNQKACGMYNLVYRNTLRNPLPKDPLLRKNTIEFRKELGVLREEYHCDRVGQINVDS